MTDKQKEKLKQIWNTLTDKEKAEYIIVQNDCYTHKGNFIRADKVVNLVSQALAEGRKEGYEQGKNNERKLQCGKKNYEKDIERLEKEKCELLGIIQGKDEVIAELKEQNEKMRCCQNCKNNYSCHYESIDELARMDCGKDLKSWELAE